MHRTSPHSTSALSPGMCKHSAAVLTSQGLWPFAHQLFPMHGTHSWTGSSQLQHSLDEKPCTLSATGAGCLILCLLCQKCTLPGAWRPCMVAFPNLLYMLSDIQMKCNYGAPLPGLDKTSDLSKQLICPRKYILVIAMNDIFTSKICLVSSKKSDV